MTTLLDLLASADVDELGYIAGRVVLAVGMTPNVPIVVPDAIEGSWRECYSRGMERLGRPKNLR